VHGWLNKLIDWLRTAEEQNWTEHTYDVGATDSAESVELKRLTDTHVSVERQQDRQPSVARTKPVGGGTDSSVQVQVQHHQEETTRRSTEAQLRDCTWTVQAQVQTKEQVRVVLTG